MLRVQAVRIVPLIETLALSHNFSFRQTKAKGEDPTGHLLGTLSDMI